MKLLTILLLPLLLLADTFILYSEKINDNYNVYWNITICKDNYLYTIMLTEPLDMSQIDKLLPLESPEDYCPQDFKHQSQFPKD